MTTANFSATSSGGFATLSYQAHEALSRLESGDAQAAVLRVDRLDTREKLVMHVALKAVTKPSEMKVHEWNILQKEIEDLTGIVDKLTNDAWSTANKIRCAFPSLLLGSDWALLRKQGIQKENVQQAIEVYGSDPSHVTYAIAKSLDALEKHEQALSNLKQPGPLQKGRSEQIRKDIKQERQQLCPLLEGRVLSPAEEIQLLRGKIGREVVIPPQYVDAKGKIMHDSPLQTEILQWLQTQILEQDPVDALEHLCAYDPSSEGRLAVWMSVQERCTTDPNFFNATKGRIADVLKEDRSFAHLLLGTYCSRCKRENLVPQIRAIHFLLQCAPALSQRGREEVQKILDNMPGWEQDQQLSAALEDMQVAPRLLPVQASCIKSAVKDKCKQPSTLTLHVGDSPLIVGTNRGAPLGAGTNGVVFPGQWGQKFCAVKKQSYKVDARNAERHWTRKAEHLAWLHQRLDGEPTILIPELVAYRTRRSRTLKAVEVAPQCGQDLWKRIYHNPSPISRKESALITRDVLRAVAFMHEKGVLHCDLKPANIVLQVNRSQTIQGIRVIDWATAEDAATARVRGEGTVCERAPEILQEKIPATKASECWAAGMTLYEMMHEGMPQPLRNLANTVEALSPQLKPDAPLNSPYAQWWNQEIAKTTDPTEKAILGLIDPNPVTRLTAAAALKMITKK